VDLCIIHRRRKKKIGIYIESGNEESGILACFLRIVISSLFIEILIASNSLPHLPASTMVKIYSLAVVYRNPTSGKGVILAKVIDEGSFGFFERKSAAEFLGFSSQMLTERTDRCARQSVKQDEYMVHCHVRADSLAGVVCTDSEYPQRVAHSLISKFLEDFAEKIPSSKWATDDADTIHFPQLSAYLAKFQNPAEADSLTKLQSELDETKIIMHDNIEKILDRGEKLDDLVAKSEGLSYQSKAFYTTARKTNSCCVIL